MLVAQLLSFFRTILHCRSILSVLKSLGFALRLFVLLLGLLDALFQSFFVMSFSSSACILPHNSVDMRHLLPLFGTRQGGLEVLQAIRPSIPTSYRVPFDI